MKRTMLQRTTLLLAAFFIAFGLTTTANAQSSNSETKIGYVNPQAILSMMPEMKAVQQRLQNFTARKEQELQQKGQNFQAEVAAFQQKAGVISRGAQTQEQERLGKLQEELIQAQSAAEQELQEKRQELVGPLLAQINTAINTVAERMELTYVLNTTTTTGDVIILYASEEYRTKYNITEQVMDELGMF